MRTDEHLARSSFRFSKEWKRTSGMAGMEPQIDARLAGTEMRDGKVFVHSLSGSERNHYFVNHGGNSFQDISALSGLDNPADGRSWAALDYDRDGWQDLALVNANQPLFNLYHNEMPAAGAGGGVIAVRFIGGNRAAAASAEYSARDGFGTRVSVDCGDLKFIREQRCGDGFAAQHSATMLLGIGARSAANSVTLTWPSGRVSVAKDVPEGTLLTAYENPADNPAGEPFARGTYRVAPGVQPAPRIELPAFALASEDTAARPDTQLRVYTTLATWCPSCKKHLPMLRRLKEDLAADGVELIAAPIDDADDAQMLATYAKKWQLPSRLFALESGRRDEVAAAFTQALGEEAPLPCTVVTDAAGRILLAQAGVPSVSTLRKMLARDP